MQLCADNDDVLPSEAPVMLRPRLKLLLAPGVAFAWATH